MSYISDRRCKLQVARYGLQMGFMMRVADGGRGLQDAVCRMQMQVAYKYGIFVYLGKVKKITNLGCSCPSPDLSFLSRDFDRGKDALSVLVENGI